MSTERIDVRALIKQAADVLDEEYFQMAAVEVAVAELIAADRELDAAVSGYNAAHVFSLGDREYISADDPAVLRLDAAKARRAAALARIGAQP